MKPTRPTVDDPATRRADLARIHIAKTALRMDDDAYRQVLRDVCGAASSSQLDLAGRRKLIAHFVRCGWDGNKPGARRAAKPSTRPRRPTPSEAVAPLCRKVRAQLISLGKLPDTYADGIAQQMWGVQYYEWLQPDQLQAVVTALAKEQEAKGVAWQRKGRAR
ncbi:MAG: regulatory protein GemA [Aquincola sp.]|nr:regulatory protein GemA [Aquincola sp.]